MEMQLVADKVDRNSDGLIDYNEFMAALRPDWEKKPAAHRGRED